MEIKGKEKTTIVINTKEQKISMVINALKGKDKPWVLYESENMNLSHSLLRFLDSEQQKIVNNEFDSFKITSVYHSWLSNDKMFIMVTITKYKVGA